MPREAKARRDFRNPSPSFFAFRSLAAIRTSVLAEATTTKAKSTDTGDSFAFGSVGNCAA